jgi:GTP-binding protein
MDMPEVEDKWPLVEMQLREKGYQDIFAISAIQNQGIKPILYRAAELLKDLPEYEYRSIEEGDEVPVYRFDDDPQDYVVLKTDRGWRITGEAIERAAAMTYWEHLQSIRRFHRILEVMGIDQSLREAGVEVGDSVFIGEHELEWED